LADDSIILAKLEREARYFGLNGLLCALQEKKLNTLRFYGSDFDNAGVSSYLLAIELRAVDIVLVGY
jgi:hypothetical protein